MSLLQVQQVSKRFGGLKALNEVGFSIEAGSIHGLIGPNGAGKSTLFKVISGFYKPTSGQIIFNDLVISGLKPNVIAHLGLVRTFQETTLFAEMTVRENVLIGSHKTAETSALRSLFNLDGEQRRRASDETDEILDFMGLTARSEQLASELPLGSQRALALAIALAAKPMLLLMDEPFAGMNPEETTHMMQLTRKLQQRGITIALVEHDMKAVMGLCERLTVLNFGQLLAQGTPKEVRENPQVIAAYLGSSHGDNHAA